MDDDTWPQHIHIVRQWLDSFDNLHMVTWCGIERPNSYQTRTDARGRDHVRDSFAMPTEMCPACALLSMQGED